MQHFFSVCRSLFTYSPNVPDRRSVCVSFMDSPLIRHPLISTTRNSHPHCSMFSLHNQYLRHIINCLLTFFTLTSILPSIAYSIVFVYLLRANNVSCPNCMTTCFLTSLHSSLKHRASLTCIIIIYFILDFIL